MSFYDVVRHNPAISSYIDKAYTIPIFTHNNSYLDTRELETEIRSMLVIIEDMVANAKCKSQNLGMSQNLEDKRNSCWSMEYIDAKESFIRKLCSEELGSKKNLHDMTNNDYLDSYDDTQDENVNEISTQETQTRSRMSKINMFQGNNVKVDKGKEIDCKLNTMPAKVRNNIGLLFSGRNKSKEFSINTLKRVTLEPSTVITKVFSNQRSHCFVSDRELASGSQDGRSISIVNLIKNEIIANIPGHKRCISSLFKWDDNIFVSSSWDGSIKIWDLKKRECVATIDKIEGNIYSARKLNDKLFISASGNTTIKIWDFKTKLCLKTFKEHTNLVVCLCVMTEKIFVS
eukprot:CAMPEP_0170521388 /NCGR_PEP_ID=MMETSP0209-20121228/6733_1 /TAXON_ID=665100 ORGANISM="Litonotus pictus, Strain P1" /NCGR_SAMPLE_ID=MMETSP0209 /ASSEMBLY_ACC=CAM_ASM_000301 /LENGTH=344 /DNA_ID=CAMNT_0010808225 /DNA_START=409 /DNA_END=1440 /DNA_ORIENTATION=+